MCIEKQNYLFHLKNIKKTYLTESRAALDVDDLIIPANSLVAIIGYSGSGKTTLLNILGLLDKPDEDENNTPIINFYDNKNNKTQILAIPNKNKFRRSTYGFVFQEGYLLHNLTGVQNVEIPLHVNKYKINSKNTFELLNKIGIDEDLIKRPPSGISGGEAQRIAIGRSIIHSPKVILADEPTSNLDYDIGMSVMSFYKQLCHQKENESERCSVIWVTHNMHQALKLADYIIVLKNGKASGPHPNPKDEEKLIEWLRQGETKEEVHETINFSKEPINSFIGKFFQLIYFIINFAVSDIFPKSVDRKKWILPRLIGVKNTQKLNMFSLFTVILLTLLIFSISFAFRNYFMLSASDPRINRITLSGKNIGDNVLTEEDRKALSGLTLHNSRIKWPDEVQTEEKNSGRRATMGAFGVRTRTFDCYMNPNSNNSTMSGRFPLSVIALNVEDPILTKVPVFQSKDKTFKNIKQSRTTVNQLFLSKDGQPQHKKEGVVISINALNKHLDYKKIPDKLIIDYHQATQIELPILGVTDWLPNSVNIMITEGWYIQEYINRGIYDQQPGYELINIYMEDKINDGIPVCNAIETKNYIISGNAKATLIWIKNMTNVIFRFSIIGIIGIWILAGTLLYVSYTQAIQKKQREIGVLMAKGISKPLLYSIFFVEIFIVWFISMLFVIPINKGILFGIKKIVETEFVLKQNMSIVKIFVMPDILWPGVLSCTFVIALIAVSLGVWNVLRHNIANILRTGN